MKKPNTQLLKFFNNIFLILLLAYDSSQFITNVPLRLSTRKYNLGLRMNYIDDLNSKDNNYNIDKKNIRKLKNVNELASIYKEKLNIKKADDKLKLLSTNVTTLSNGKGYIPKTSFDNLFLNIGSIKNIYTTSVSDRIIVELINNKRYVYYDMNWCRDVLELSKDVKILFTFGIFSNFSKILSTKVSFKSSKFSSIFQRLHLCFLLAARS